MFDFILLFKREEGSEEIPSLVRKIPEGVDFIQDEFQYITPNSIPRKYEKSEIYMINSDSQYYYDYSFKIENIDASIVIVSSHFHPSLYIDFLRAVDSSFDIDQRQGTTSNVNLNLNDNSKKNVKKKEIDVETFLICRFVYVHSLLTSWSSNDDGDLVINYPFDSFVIKLSPDLSVYSPKYQININNANKNQTKNKATKQNIQQLNRIDALKAEDDAICALHSWTDVFDVAPLVPHVETVWATAIQNKGVLVVAQNASIASSSAISILSILEPMKYAEPCLLFSQIGDPRFTIESLAPNALKFSKDDKKKFNESNQKVNNQDNLSKYKIVATTYESYSKLVGMISEKTSLTETESIGLINQNFAAIITIKATSFRSSGNIKRMYSKKTKQILKKFLALMNLTLLNDPYFDILGKEIDGSQFVHTWPNDYIVFASALSLNSKNNFFNSISNSTSIEALNEIDTLTNNNDPNTNQNEETNKNNLNNDSDDKKPSIAELIQFYKNIQKTKTFQKWRHAREDRDQLRMGFLSVTPKEAVDKIPDEKLQEAYEKVTMLIYAHKKDEHFRIILSKNLSFIKKRIQKNQSK